jgi:SAM-dependent methyltransferase
MLRWELDWIREFARTTKALSGPVLDLGSQDENYRSKNCGGYKLESIFFPRKVFFSDLVPGRGVDIVCDAEYIDRYLVRGSMSIVVSSNLLQYVESPGRVISAVSKVLHPRGEVIFIVPKVYPGKDDYEVLPRHDFAGTKIVDRRRFRTEEVVGMVEDAGMTLLYEHLGGSSVATSICVVAGNTEVMYAAEN